MLQSRPTAVNLREALDRIKAIVAREETDVVVLRKAVVEICVTVWCVDFSRRLPSFDGDPHRSEDVERNHRIGDNGAKWLLETLEADGTVSTGDKVCVLTVRANLTMGVDGRIESAQVCNTGSLATSGYGTALGMITSLHLMGRLEHAYYAQTGPYQQGARLTSLELHNLGIPATMCLDTAVAALLAGKHGRKIHAFIAGADRCASSCWSANYVTTGMHRVTANGDTANKISTFQISTLCHAAPSPPPRVVICAPLTTLDLSMPTGESIHIEIRPEIEAKTVRGRPLGHDVAETGLLTVQFVPDFASVWNPAFDVTPARLIDAVVTEVGVATKREGVEEDFDLASFVHSVRA